MRKIFSSVVTLAVALAMVACGGNSNKVGRESQELSGAGATFPLRHSLCRSIMWCSSSLGK